MRIVLQIAAPRAPGPPCATVCESRARSNFPETVKCDGARHMGGTVWYQREGEGARDARIDIVLEIAAPRAPGPPCATVSEIGILLPSNQRKHRTLHIQKDVLPYPL
jgi:hypothetical protein